MNAIAKIQPSGTVVQLAAGEWVHQCVIETMFGFTKDQLKKYLAGSWLEEKHWRRNPANRIVYNPKAIGSWMGGDR